MASLTVALQAYTKCSWLSVYWVNREPNIHVQNLTSLSDSKHSATKKGLWCVQVPASCSGPTIILALEPHECLLDDSTKQVTCKPAQLVLTKLAGMTSNITVLQ